MVQSSRTIASELRACCAIVAACVLLAVAYGILHDQITIRVCPEYFTVAHRPVFRTDSLTLLALGWGVIATWWAGAIIGLLLSVAARAGRRPPAGLKGLRRELLTLFLVMGCLALAAGFVAFLAAQHGHLRLLGWLAENIPAERHSAFIADSAAHTVSYASGFVGGIVIATRTWRRRASRFHGTNGERA